MLVGGGQGASAFLNQERFLTKRYMPEIFNLSLSIMKKGREQGAAYRSKEDGIKCFTAKSAKGGDLFWISKRPIYVMTIAKSC
ncbi:hypothetical protein P2R12_14390 [Cytobacillus oceanisediminis]|uniref:hypothetical protein n=1 Tax=Cytobacillus oceanisediminis TaxID=665099 RepID=UPI0023DC35F3|nr:hypothetical protein [Cytobacillus oceanisediminis]MDF2038151.1 hypothetical protein [Cytobacillus oceanisediminis]